MIDKNYEYIEEYDAEEENLYPCPKCEGEILTLAKSRRKVPVKGGGPHAHAYTMLCRKCGTHSEFTCLSKPEAEESFAFFMMELWNACASDYIAENETLN